MSKALPGADSVGRLIDGRFALLRWLGGTESSSVFLTEIGDEPKRKAAIKFIPADPADAEASIAQWEADKALSHPHLIGLLDHGRAELDGEDLLFSVTEYADEVLSEILPERPLTPAETREMLGPVLDALTFLHGRDLVHGDLKPSNIMVVDDQLKLSADRLRVAGGPLRRPQIVMGCAGDRRGEDHTGGGFVVARRGSGSGSHPKAAAMGQSARRGAGSAGSHPSALLRCCAGVFAG